MSRRRSTDPAIPVSVAIPRSLHTRLNELLAYKQSRSRWVCEAILAKLDAHDSASQVIDGISNDRLLAIITNRGIIDYATYTLLRAKLPAEEIAE